MCAILNLGRGSRKKFEEGVDAKYNTSYLGDMNDEKMKLATHEQSQFIKPAREYITKIKDAWWTSSFIFLVNKEKRRRRVIHAKKG